MSDSQRRINLQRKVRNIALWCIGLHVIKFAGGITHYVISKYIGYRKTFLEEFPRVNVKMVIIESLVGIAACVLLFIGAKRKIKCLLFPFMLVLLIYQLLFVIAIVVLGRLCFNKDDETPHFLCEYLSCPCKAMVQWMCLNGIYFELALIIALLFLTRWMLKIITSLYSEIRLYEKYISNLSFVLNNSCSTIQ